MDNTVPSMCVYVCMCNLAACISLRWSHDSRRRYPSRHFPHNSTTNVSRWRATRRSGTHDVIVNTSKHAIHPLRMCKHAMHCCPRMCLAHIPTSAQLWDWPLKHLPEHHAQSSSQHATQKPVTQHGSLYQGLTSSTASAMQRPLQPTLSPRGKA